MQLSAAIHPISEVKAQAAETILTFSEEVAPLVVITQNSEAKAVPDYFLHRQVCKFHDLMALQ